MPALVPELLERREQDRRRRIDLEKKLRDVEATNKQLTVAERIARERAEYEARARAEFAAAESVRIRELQLRIRELETAQRQAVEAESQARGAAEESRVEVGKLAAAAHLPGSRMIPAEHALRAALARPWVQRQPSDTPLAAVTGHQTALDTSAA